MPGIYADLEACRSMNRQAVWGTWFDSRLFGVDLVVSWKPANTKLLMLGMLVSALHKQNSGEKLIASFGPCEEDCHFARSLEASLRSSDEKMSCLECQCHEGHFHAILGKIVRSENLEKLWRWQLKIMKIHLFLHPDACFLRVFCMDISHLRFVWRQVLCQKGSWQGQGWKSIQTCLMMVLWCPMLAKCWQMYTLWRISPFGQSKTRLIEYVWSTNVLSCVFCQYKYASKHNWILV